MTSSGEVWLREATEADWPAIWPFFAAVVADGETYAYPLDLTSDEARGWWLESPPGRCVVAVDESGAVLGSAKMGPNRPGRGVGRALAVEAVQWLRGSGFRGIQFNAVVETNTAAVRLWQSLGFAIIGTVPEAFDSRTHGLVGLHVMYLDLTR